MMRISTLTYDENRECSGCTPRDEKQISTYILAFQIAEHFLAQKQGGWSITENEIILRLENLEYPLIIDNAAGTLNYGTLTTSFYNRYSAKKGIKVLVKEICEDFAIVCGQDTLELDYLFKVLVKMVEIYHANCNLRILPGKSSGEWVIGINSDGPVGWIGEDMIAENRFGEKIDISQWKDVKTEKAATYIFGFNRFCKDFECPLK